MISSWQIMIRAIPMNEKIHESRVKEKLARCSKEQVATDPLINTERSPSSHIAANRKMSHFPFTIIKINHFWKGDPCHNDVTTWQKGSQLFSFISNNSETTSIWQSLFLYQLVIFLESIMILVRSTVHALLLASTFTLVYNCQECTKDLINPVLSKINSSFNVCLIHISWKAENYCTFTWSTC